MLRHPWVFIVFQCFYSNYDVIKLGQAIILCKSTSWFISHQLNPTTLVKTTWYRLQIFVFICLILTSNVYPESSKKFRFSQSLYCRAFNAPFCFQIIAEYKETNKQLQKQVEAGPSVQISPPSPVDKSNTLEADDSKTDTSLIESTPIAKKKGGRGRGRVNRTTR